MALWYHTRAVDFIDLDAPAIADALDEFVREGLLIHAQKKSKVKFVGTEKLHAFVDLLCATPLPVRVWMSPDEAASRIHSIISHDRGDTITRASVMKLTPFKLDELFPFPPRFNKFLKRKHKK